MNLGESSKILLTRKDLNRFLKQWEGIQVKIQKLRHSLGVEGEAVQRWLDELSRLHESIKPGSRIREWQEHYSRLKRGFPSKLRLRQVSFDTLSNRAFYSRQEVQRFWGKTEQNLRNLKFWQIRPGSLFAALRKDFMLTMSFAFNFRAATRQPDIKA